MSTPARHPSAISAANTAMHPRQPPLVPRSLAGPAPVGTLQAFFDASASVATGVGREMGTFATAGLGASLPLPPGWFGRVSGLAVVGDEDNVRWDFGVSPAQAERRHALLAARAPGLRPGDDVGYAPGGGLRELRGMLLLARALGPRLTVSATTGPSAARG